LQSFNSEKAWPCGAADLSGNASSSRQFTAISAVLHLRLAPAGRSGLSSSKEKLLYLSHFGPFCSTPDGLALERWKAQGLSATLHGTDTCPVSEQWSSSVVTYKVILVRAGILSTGSRVSVCAGTTNWEAGGHLPSEFHLPFDDSKTTAIRIMVVAGYPGWQEGALQARQGPYPHSDLAPPRG